MLPGTYGPLHPSALLELPGRHALAVQWWALLSQWVCFGRSLMGSDAVHSSNRLTVSNAVANAVRLGIVSCPWCHRLKQHVMCASFATMVCYR